MYTNSLGGAQENLLYYTLTNIHKFKVGTITKIVNNEYAEVNLHINENGYDMSSMSFPILPLFINFEYKVNQDVIIMFFDDYELNYIIKKTNKILSLDSLYLKHALSNGFILCPLRKQNDYNITFTQDGDININTLQSTINVKHTGEVIIINNQTKANITLNVDGTITIANQATTLATLLINMLNSFVSNVKILDSKNQLCSIDATNWIQQNTTLIQGLFK